MTERREQPGLGRVVYSVDEDLDHESPREKKVERIERAEVDEADKESFPASDAPSFAGGKESECA